MVVEPPRTSIRRKLMKAIMATSIAAVVLTCAAFVACELVTFRQHLMRALTTRAEIVAANSTAALAFQNEEDAADVLAALGRDPHMMAAALYDADGAIFARFLAPGVVDRLAPRPGEHGARFERGSCIVVAPVAQGGQRLGSILLESNLSAMTERYRLYALVCAGVLAGSCVFAYLLSSWLQSRIARPVLDLAETARQVSESKDYSLRAAHQTDDEIGLLTSSFNDMLREIQEGERSLRETEARVRQLNTELERRVLERTAQLESANKELEAFSYSVSHDLRAPLRAIDGFSKAILEDSGDRLDEEAQGHLSRVRSATQRMGSLIDDLLKLSRISRGEMKPSPVDLSEMVRQIASELRESQPNRSVDFAIEDDLRVEADAHLLRVVVENLLRNSWKYTSKHESARIEVGAEWTATGRAYFVRDDGAGFDMEHAALLFAPFQRLHRQSDFEGTGVGLATVQRIIRRHGGTVWAKGEVEKGATFHFTLWEKNGHE